MSLPTLPQRILLAVESAPLGQSALEAVLPIAQRAGAIVDLVHVWEPIPFVPPNAGFHHDGATRSYQEIAETEGRQALKALAKFATQSGVKLGTQQVLEGNPAEVIGEVAAASDSELVVLTTHQRHGASRWVQGSVSEKVMRLCSCPVLVVPVSPS